MLDNPRRFDANEHIFYKLFRTPWATYPRERNCCPTGTTNIIHRYTNILNSERIHIDATSIKQALFPFPEQTIFISHLRAEREKAQEVKKRIERDLPSCSCFIDSDVWHNVSEAAEILRRDYDMQVNETGNCRMRDSILIKLHLTFSMIMAEAIRESAAFIYVPHSHREQPSINAVIADSPWVCHELQIASVTWGRPLHTETPGIDFDFNAPVRHLSELPLRLFIQAMRARLF